MGWHSRLQQWVVSRLSLRYGMQRDKRQDSMPAWYIPLTRCAPGGSHHGPERSCHSHSARNRFPAQRTSTQHSTGFRTRLKGSGRGARDPVRTPRPSPADESPSRPRRSPRRASALRLPQHRRVPQVARRPAQGDLQHHRLGKPIPAVTCEHPRPGWPSTHGRRSAACRCVRSPVAAERRARR